MNQDRDIIIPNRRSTTMRWPAYAMDTGFYSRQGSYDFGARCEITKELGFDATYLTLWSEAAWADVPKLETVREKYDPTSRPSTARST
jgi:hypothetical protein